jgi:hypothetical protein
MMGGIRPGVFARLTRKTSGHTKEDGREIGWVNNPGYVDGSIENEAMWSSDSRMASGHVGRL